MTIFFAGFAVGVGAGCVAFVVSDAIKDDLPHRFHKRPARSGSTTTYVKENEVQK